MKKVAFHLAATHYDNRGSPDVPYGFVYFNDDTRIGYPAFDNDKPIDGSTFDGNWGGNTARHHELAKAYLRKRGVKGYEE